MTLGGQGGYASQMEQHHRPIYGQKGMSSITDWDFTGKKIKMPLQKKAMTRFKLSWYLDKKVLKIPYLHFALLLTGN